MLFSTEEEICGMQKKCGEADFFSLKAGGDALNINLRHFDDRNSKASIVQNNVNWSSDSLKLQVATSTDWAIFLVGVGSIVSSCLIAYIASRTQKNQVKSNIANLRQRWIEELRQTAVEFCEKAVLISNNFKDDPNYLKKPEGRVPFSSLVSSAAKLTLMLDMKHESNEKVDSLVHTIVGHLREYKKGSLDPEFSDSMDEFRTLIREILEDTWVNIKKDLKAHK